MGASSLDKKTEQQTEMEKDFKNSDMLQIAKDELSAMFGLAAKAAMEKEELPRAELPPFVVEIPADTANGDFAANIAMVSAKVFSMPPRKIAEAVVKNFPVEGIVEKVEVAGPGFINIFCNHSWFSSCVMAPIVLGEDYGRTDFGAGKKVNVEFVSANPTGPMHIGNARGGALGDVLAELMKWAGYDITREFYLNDAGNQIVKFAVSLEARYLQIINGEAAVDFPEDGYQGEDIKVLAQEYYKINGDVSKGKTSEDLRSALVDYALPANIAKLKADIEKYKVFYDVWFNESSLYETGEVESAIAKLKERGATYEKDGAIWYKASDFGAEKDEVLIRANGIPTYFAADIAYHANKFARGFDLAIDIWGADHHGHVARMKGVMDAIGLESSRLDIVLMQFVTLMQDGKPVKMSKRTGKAITLTDLLEEVPLDSARFIFNMQNPGSRIEFDLDLAIKQDSQNPVYYVQYAHARICSILRALEVAGVTFDQRTAFANLVLLVAPEEKELIRKISALSSEIINTAKSYDPSRITHYIMDVAALFHKFYNACHVKGEKAELTQARLALCIATKTVIANCLHILKVTVPEKM